MSGLHPLTHGIIDTGHHVFVTDWHISDVRGEEHVWLLEMSYSFSEPDDDDVSFVTIMIDQDWERYGIGEALWVICNQQDEYVYRDLD